MTQKPPSVDIAHQQDYSTKEDIHQSYAPRHQALTKYLITNQNLTTNGIQWSAVSSATTASSKTSAILTVGSSVDVAWPGLENFYLVDPQAGLTMGAIKSTASTGNKKSTVGYRWEMRDDNETTWTAISTWKLFPVSSTSAYKERTVSGYVKTGAGYNQLPVGIRLRAYAITVKAKFKIKNSSYVALRVKKQS